MRSPYDAPVRIVILGGTQFVGRAIAERLAREHQLLLVHRGVHEPDDGAVGEHLHVDRADLLSVRTDLAAFAPDVAIDVYGMNAEDARIALAALPDGTRVVAISSMDVYQAYASLHRGLPIEAVPLDESAPRRAPEHWHIDRPEWEKVELEDVYLTAGATVLRLGAVYGPHDTQRRLELVLRRVRAGRTRIPVGAGTFLFSRVFVDDVADAVARVLTHDAPGEAFNVCERRTWTYRRFVELILEAAGSDARLVTVPDSALPPDLLMTASVRQHLLGDADKARQRLGWEDTDPWEALVRTVEWDLAHPPADGDLDVAADDAALAAAGS